MKSLGTTKSDDLEEPSMIEVETRSVVKDELLLPTTTMRSSRTPEPSHLAIWFKGLLIQSLEPMDGIHF